MTCSRTAGVEEVELRGVVPREARAVVAVVDVANVAGPAVDALEDDRRVAVVPVVVLEDDPDPRVGRQVRPVERVRPGRAAPGSDRNHSGWSMTQRESMPMWFGTMSLASRMPRAATRGRAGPRRPLSPPRSSAIR